MKRTLATLRGLTFETAWIAAHLATYPFGVAAESGLRAIERYSLAGLSPEQRGLLVRDVEAAGTPIVLLHGFADNRSVFHPLRRTLRRWGFGRVTTMNYSPLLRDVRAAARDLGGLVERLCAETGYERVHVVGHSLGGVIARYYVQRLGGDARVHTLVTLGSPHRGTHLARALPRGVCRQITPGSALLRELAEPAPGCRTRFLAFWADLDQLIVPRTSAQVEHPDLRARNVHVRGVGHMSLPVNGKVVHEIVATLAHLGTDGTTIRHGVTPIASATADPPGVTRGGTVRRAGTAGH